MKMLFFPQIRKLLGSPTQKGNYLLPATLKVIRKAEKHIVSSCSLPFRAMYPSFRRLGPETLAYFYLLKDGTILYVQPHFWVNTQTLSGGYVVYQASVKEVEGLLDEFWEGDVGTNVPMFLQKVRDVREPTPV